MIYQNIQLLFLCPSTYSATKCHIIHITKTNKLKLLAMTL